MSTTTGAQEEISLDDVLSVEPLTEEPVASAGPEHGAAIRRFMGPLRRVVQFGLDEEGKQLSKMRYFETNTSRMLKDVLVLKLPEELNEPVSRIRGLALGFDDAEIPSKFERLQEISTILGQLDGLVGAAPPKPKRQAKPKRGERGRDRGRGRGRDRDRDRKRDSVAKAAPKETRERELPKLRVRKKNPPHSFGDVEMTGQLLRDLEVASDTADALEALGISTVAEMLFLPPVKAASFKPIYGAGRNLPAGDAAVAGRIVSRKTQFNPDGTAHTVVVLQGSGRAEAVWEWEAGVSAPNWLIEALEPGQKVILVGNVRGAAVDEGIAAAVDEGIEAAVEEGIEAAVEEGIEAAVEEGIEAAVEEGIEVAVEEGSEAAAEEASEAADETEVLVIEQDKDAVTGPLWNPEIAFDDGQRTARLLSYGLKGVSDKELRDLFRQIGQRLEGLKDPFSPQMCRSLELPLFSDALALVHQHGTDTQTGWHRLAFDEAFFLQLGLAVKRYGQAKNRGLGHSLVHGMLGRMCHRLGVATTDEQQSALEDIKRDLRGRQPMRRVLTGQPGMGKGFVAALTAVMIAESRAQVMILAPDKSHAEALYLFAAPLLRELGLVARLFEGAPSDAQLDAIRRGEVHIVYGSSELLSKELEFRRLGLVVNHSSSGLGELQEWMDELSGAVPDLLVLRNMPFEFSELFGQLGSFDISWMSKPDKGFAQTLVLGSEDRHQAYEHIMSAVHDGGQALIVFPLAKGKDVLELEQARSLVAALQLEAFEGASVALFHGAMPREERTRVYEDFGRRRIDVLVATTYIEEGRSTPHLKVTMVEQADRMDTERLLRIWGQLHGDGRATCICIKGDVPDEGGLKVLTSFAKGYAAWEEAPFLHGSSSEETSVSVNWLDVQRDRSLLLYARKVAHGVLQEDTSLQKRSNIGLVNMLRWRWNSWFEGECPVAVPSTKTDESAAGSRRRRRRRRR